MEQPDGTPLNGFLMAGICFKKKKGDMAMNSLVVIDMQADFVIDYNEKIKEICNTIVYTRDSHAYMQEKHKFPKHCIIS